MKNLVFLIIVFVVSPALSEQTSWTPVSQEQAEYDFLIQECLKISNYYYSLSNGNEALSSLMPRIGGAIFQYLKKVGTPVSLRVLKEKVAEGTVPAYYLKLI